MRTGCEVRKEFKYGRRQKVFHARPGKVRIQIILNLVAILIKEGEEDEKTKVNVYSQPDESIWIVEPFTEKRNNREVVGFGGMTMSSLWDLLHLKGLRLGKQLCGSELRSWVEIEVLESLTSGR